MWVIIITLAIGFVSLNIGNACLRRGLSDEPQSVRFILAGVVSMLIAAYSIVEAISGLVMYGLATLIALIMTIAYGGTI